MAHWFKPIHLIIQIDDVMVPKFKNIFPLHLWYSRPFGMNFEGTCLNNFKKWFKNAQCKNNFKSSNVTNWFRFIYFEIWGSGPLQWEYCNKIIHLYFHFSYFDGVLNTQKL
jgi:hypothetical protein